MIFKAPAILTRIGATKDNGLSLGFHTNEIDTATKLQAFGMHQQFGYLLFKENEIGDEDIPDTDAADETKTPSQRLRATLFVLWKQRGQKEDFEIFYRRQMEQAINRVKALLD